MSYLKNLPFSNNFGSFQYLETSLGLPKFYRLKSIVVHHFKKFYISNILVNHHWISCLKFFQCNFMWLSGFTTITSLSKLKSLQLPFLVAFLLLLHLTQKALQLSVTFSWSFCSVFQKQNDKSFLRIFHHSLRKKRVMGIWLINMTYHVFSNHMLQK